MSLTHLRRDQRNDGNAELAAPVPGAQSDYSYGLVVRLENNELQKLQVKQLPRVGQEVTITARAKVIRVAESSSTQNKGDRNVELQITHMEIGRPGEVKEERAEQRPGGAGKANVGQAANGAKRANVGQVAGSDRKANVGRAGKTDSAFAE